MTYDIPKTLLGRTSLQVTRFGVGGAYCESAEGYRAALDCGVRYVDTARGYRDGEDEKVIGQAIKGRRDDLILATKTVQRDAEGARRDLETSLRLLNTDHIDIYQLHHLNTEEERDRALGPGGAMETVQKAREEGLVRFIGGNRTRLGSGAEGDSNRALRYCVVLVQLCDERAGRDGLP